MDHERCLANGPLSVEDPENIHPTIQQLLPDTRSVACKPVLQTCAQESATIHSSSERLLPIRRSPKRFRTSHVCDGVQDLLRAPTTGEPLELANGAPASIAAPLASRKKRCVLNSTVSLYETPPKFQSSLDSMIHYDQTVDDKDHWMAVLRFKRDIVEFTHKSSAGFILPVLSNPDAIVKRSTVQELRQFGLSKHLLLSSPQISHLICRIMPISNCLRSRPAHLVELYRCIDLLGGRRARCRRTDAQIDCMSATRRSMVMWMSDISHKMNWSTPSCYSAIETLDAYLTLAEHQIPLSSLSKLAATCLYYASHLQETTVDDKMPPVDRFLAICPEIGTTQEFIDHQVHLVDTLQGMNFSRKTPFDYTTLFLARMQCMSGLIGETLYMTILHQGFLPLILETMQIATLSFYYPCGVNRHLPAPVWVFCGLYHIILHLILESPAASDSWLLLCGLSLDVLVSLDNMERRRFVVNMVKATLLEATHLGCDGHNCADGKINQSKATVRQANLTASDDDVESFLHHDFHCVEGKCDAESDAAGRLDNRHGGLSPCPISAVMETQLVEAAIITELVFVHAVEIARRSTEMTYISKDSRGDHPLSRTGRFLLPENAILELQLVRLQKLTMKSDHINNSRTSGRAHSSIRTSRYNGGSAISHHAVKTTTSDLLTVNLLRPQVLWNHRHPDRQLHELDLVLRKIAPQVLKRLDLSSVLSDRFFRPSVSAPQTILSDRPPSATSASCDGGRRASVSNGLMGPTKAYKRASIQAPNRRLKG
eukprot:GHVH01005282.1.p1 GENE.GHVH01005282.1~~GHVH01005282.1.p1  ORF type:complete len:769 (+),score=65.64 GHVH01005282.1:395-2701(+)